MTRDREEAIKTIETAKIFAYDECYEKAFDIAIKALEQEPCEDVVSRAEVKKIAKEMYLEVANMELDVNTISDCISCTSSKCREVLERKLQALPSVTLPNKALEQESCEDAVSRQAVDNLAWEYLTKATDENIAFYEHFLDLPSVTPQKPKTGHWIDTGSGQKCSECGEIQYGYDNFRHFCANCGTKMDKEYTE